MKATIVYEKNWNAIHATNPDGTRRFRYIINKGSSRSSKTRSLIDIFWLYGWANQNKRLSVWRNTKKDCKDTVGHDMRRVYPFMPNYRTEYFNKSESVYTLPTMSAIEIRGTDDEEQVMGYNGEVAWLNEPYKISKDTFDQIDQRTEDFIIIDWNPKKAHWVLDLEKDARAIVIHSTFRDNPFCPREQKIKILSYQPVKMCSVVVDKIMTEIEAKAYDLTENKRSLSERQIKELARCKENERKNSASAYKWSVYGLGIKAEKPNRIFNWEEISDDQYNAIDAKRYYGTDWGTVDPWGILEAKYYDGALYLRELNYRSENEIRQGLTPTEVQQIESMDEGIVRWHFERLGVPKNEINICDDNRPLKVRALREAGWDYAITAIKGQGSVMDGINLLENLKVYYTSSSKNLAYEQENYERKVDRYGIVIDDEPEDRDNHLIDPARYIATWLQVSGIIKVI
jgi:phage terminase large subunit